ncbi:uncharacterized protein BO96DRAFT_501443 [Aspergillus niger CBS 101883]|uniref:uncharacterized protein n=1 Tax=Aspergillus lacticoffeatus (strain CBS 101883) TaxID=1450533 RepID=UPI000D7EEC7B|nr:uncharacterized protein BO96DRAFT_501443 [Aspergillus niger CBS 101883]PYH55015.1 hypothetical protein BO96DRAFT_501443 [Aspergillus niger CBS 101883]
MTPSKDPFDIDVSKAVPKLKGQANWLIWQRNLRNYLRSRNSDAWDLLQGKYTLPEEPVLYPEDEDENMRILAVRAVLGTTCEASPAARFQNCDSVLKAYVLLQEAYETSNFATVVRLYNKWAFICYKSTSSQEIFLTRYADALNELHGTKIINDHTELLQFFTAIQDVPALQPRT